jgi:hypothetical protein
MHDASLALALTEMMGSEELTVGGFGGEGGAAGKVRRVCSVASDW